jgi:hypothetical protein
MGAWMMRKWMALFVTGLILVAGTLVADGKLLRNKDIVKMVAAGLDSDVIVETIQSNPQKFDLDTDGLIALKSAKVPSTIIKAMISKAGNSDSGSGSPNALLAAAGRSGSDGLAEALTDSTAYCIGKDGKTKMFVAQAGKEYRRGFVDNFFHWSYPGKQSSLRISDPNVKFNYPIPRNVNPQDGVILVRLKQGRKERAFDDASDGITVAQQKTSGISKKVLVPITIKVLRNGTGLVVLEVVPKDPLDDGEYVLHGAYGDYDFGVDGN